VISLEAYYKGRDREFAHELTDEIASNAQRTVDLANELLERAGRSDIHTANSGWRPGSVNAAVSGAAARSRHITAEAVDIPDPDGLLADWCMDNLDVLKEIGVWIEHPSWTKGWLHVQIVPPGNPPRPQVRVFIPNSNPPYTTRFGTTPVYA
jgi:hypothetical protein